jgi:MoaD family protein
MKLRVQYTAQLRTAVGRPEDEVDLPVGSNLAGLIDQLSQRLDGVASRLIAPAGRLDRNLLVVVNGHAIAWPDALATELQDGDVVLLLPPIAGG